MSIYKKIFISLLITLSLSSCGGNSEVPQSTFTITFNSNGGSEISSQKVKSGDMVIRPTDPIKKDYFFENWYKENTFVNIFDFSTPINSSFTLYAKWLTWDEAHGVIPYINRDTLTYGLYPQSHVNDSSLIEELEKIAPAKDEEYFLYENEYYVKDTGNPCENSYSFYDNTPLIKGETYYFKCEAIKWNIISRNGAYLLECLNILYATNFDASSSNNYKNSDIRKWLNSTFYNDAFFLNNSFIEITHVDNSASTTDSETNPYASEDTDDKIFLRSYQDFYNIPQSSRTKKVTDFAICNFGGMKNDSSSKYFRNGYYWTRSPMSIGAEYAWSIGYAGRLNNLGLVSYSDNGCVPSLTIKF